MKKFDIEKNKALKLMGDLKQSRTPGRFGQAAGAPTDKREQRKLDQAAGLVPFSVKLKLPLVNALRARAEEKNEDLNDVVAALLEDALKG